MKYVNAIIVALTTVLTACGPNTASVAGDYTSQDGRDHIVFTSSGKVQVSYFGEPKEANYTMEGKAIKFQFDGGMPQTFVLNSDGSLTSNTATKYKKNQ